MLALPCGPAMAGHNADGAMVLHTNDAVTYSIGSNYCANYPLPPACVDLATQSNRIEQPAIIWVVGAFPDSASPEVRAYQFGISHNLDPESFVRYGPCGPGFIEIGDPTWPHESGSGTAVAYSQAVNPQPMFKMYWFAVTGIVGSYLQTSPYHPGSDQAAFWDGSVVDPCQRFGTLRWGTPGENQCPGPRTFIVRPDGTGDFVTIQAAIDSPEVLAGDTIALTDGIFAGDGNRDIRYRGKAITVKSQSGNPLNCTVNPGGSYPFDPHAGFDFSDGEGRSSVLEGITISGSVSGGGMRIYSSPHIRNCRIVSNTSQGYHGDGNGGGIYCNGGPLFTDCTISSNSARGFDGYIGYGGGIDCDGSPEFVRCVVSHNGATKGGAIHVRGGVPVFTQCTLESNGAGAGGHVFCTGTSSSPVFSECSFADGSASAGGGTLDSSEGAQPSLTACRFNLDGGQDAYAVYVYDAGFAHFQNCEFTSTDRAEFGFWGGTGRFDNCTFASIGGGGGGGALFHVSADSDVNVANSIIAFNETTGDLFNCSDSATNLYCSDVYGNAGGVWTGCIAWQAWTNGNFERDPGFCQLETGEFTLQADSPCLPGQHPYDPNCGLIGAYGQGCADVGLEGVTASSLGDISILPNPSDRETTVRYTLNEETTVAASVFDAGGRLVLHHPIGTMSSGRQTFVWDGRDALGRVVPAGAYFLRLTFERERPRRLCFVRLR
jgi:hypothetical protein